jgi:hypothetical protein
MVVQRPAAAGAGVAGADAPQVRPAAHHDVALDIDVAQVEPVGVGAGHHVAPALQRGVGDYRQVADADRAQAARRGAERRLDLVGVGRPDRRGAGLVDQLLLHQGVVAAQQHQGELPVDDVGQGLDLPLAGHPVGRRLQVGDGLHARSGELLGGRHRGGVLGRRHRRGGLLDVGGVVAGGAADDVVLARLGGGHELHRGAPAHGAAGRLGGDERDAQAREDPAVRLVVQVEGAVQPRLVQVEAVGVLHGELPHPQQAGLGAGLVAELGLDLVPDLRQLAVGAQLQRQQREDLLVGHAEREVGAPAVAQPEHLLAHGRPAAGPLPDLGRVHHRQQELLAADAVHLLADDLDDPGPHPHRQRQQRVVAGHELADVAGPQQQPVAGGVGTAGVLPEGWCKQLCPAHRACDLALSVGACHGPGGHARGATHTGVASPPVNRDGAFPSGVRTYSRWTISRPLGPARGARCPRGRALATIGGRTATCSARRPGDQATSHPATRR